MPVGNLLLSSEAFDAGSWARGNLAGVTANVTTDPLGTSLADKLVENAALGQHYVTQGVARGAVAMALTFSVYLKSAGRTSAVIYLSDGTGFMQTSVNLTTGVGTPAVLVPEAGMSLSGGGASDAGGGWWRTWVAGTLPATTTFSNVWIFPNTNGSYTGDGVSGIYAFGAVLSGGIGPPPYTDSTAAMRYRRMGVARSFRGRR